MKKLLLCYLVFGVNMLCISQSFVVNDISATEVDGGINVHLIGSIGNNAGLIGHEYIITQNVIELSICYWFGPSAGGTNIIDDFFIPLTENSNYTINVEIMLSISPEVCTNYSNPYNGTLNVDYTLSVAEVELLDKVYLLFPNPSNGVVSFTGSASNIVSIDIYDSVGRLVKSFGAVDEQSIDIKSLKDGVYFVKILTDRGSTNQKVVVRSL